MPYDKYLKLVNDYLDNLLPAEDTPPQPIYRSMRYSLFAGGKRLRPILCLLGAEALEGTAEELLPVAASIEMIHTYSLIHGSSLHG